MRCECSISTNCTRNLVLLVVNQYTFDGHASDRLEGCSCRSCCCSPCELTRSHPGRSGGRRSRSCSAWRSSSSLSPSSAGVPASTGGRFKSDRRGRPAEVFNDKLTGEYCLCISVWPMSLRMLRSFRG